MHLKKYVNYEITCLAFYLEVLTQMRYPNKCNLSDINHWLIKLTIVFSVSVLVLTTGGIYIIYVLYYNTIVVIPRYLPDYK